MINSLISLIPSLEHGGWSLIIAGLSIISITISLVCLEKNFTSLLDTVASDSIISHEAQLSYGILLVATGPLLIDTLLDYDDFYNITKWKRYIFGRIPIAVMGFLISLQFFLISAHPSIFGLTNNAAASYLYCLTCFRVVFIACLMFMLTNVMPSIFQGWLTTFITLMISSISCTRMYTLGSGPKLTQVTAIANDICAGLLGIILIYWVYKLIKTRKHMTVQSYTGILYLGTFFIGILISYISVFKTRQKSGFSPAFQNFTAQDIAFVNCSYALMFIILTLVPGRIARFEAVVHLVS